MNLYILWYYHNELLMGVYTTLKKAKMRAPPGIKWYKTLFKSNAWLGSTDSSTDYVILRIKANSGKHWDHITMGQAYA